VESGVLVLAGPTASGKTELALELAERFDAEIVSADSRQIYRGMSIGTAAPTPAQRARVPHHLVDFLDPRERYSAARFAQDALTAIAAIQARGRRALVVGGTGFYIRALCGDVSLSAAFDPALRTRLAREARLHPTQVLYDWLAVRDPDRAKAVAPSDPYRVVRALEIALTAGRESESGGTAHASLPGAGLKFIKVGLEIASEALDERIASRIDKMLASGLLGEAQRIGAGAIAADAVGYPQALAYLTGQLTSAELRTLLIRATRRYAKRQRTWFRSEPSIRFISHEDASNSLARVARELPGWA
jgi:tRNA dimethylallyltransferase